MKPKPIGNDIDEAALGRFWAKVQKGGPDDCWLWTGAGSDYDGRGKFGIKRGGRQRGFNVPRVAFWASTGIDPGDQQVLHSCNNAACCNPNHFYLGTDADNRQDSVRAGTQYRGEDHHEAKLTVVTVVEIKRALAAGARGVTLAQKHGVCEKTISNIRRGAAWAWVIVPGFQPMTHHGNKRVA